VNGKIDRVHMKQVALTRFDIQLLTLLMKTGGEYAMPATQDAQIGVKVSASKNLVEIISRVGENPRVRLTDEGRRVLEQLEVMANQPKVEVYNR
jgi:hypothetical protein